MYGKYWLCMMQNFKFKLCGKQLRMKVEFEGLIKSQRRSRSPVIKISNHQKNQATDQKQILHPKTNTQSHNISNTAQSHNISTTAQSDLNSKNIQSNVANSIQQDSIYSKKIRNRLQMQKKEKQDYNKNQKLFTRIIFYENNPQSSTSQSIVEGFYKDGSSLSWKSHNIVYLSSKGIKTRLNFNDIHRSQELTSKITHILHKINCLNDGYFTINDQLQQKIAKTLHNSKSLQNSIDTPYNTKNTANISNTITEVTLQTVYKPYKIQQYHWEQSAIFQTSQGYSISSNDQNATLLLHYDLFRITISYLQLTLKRKTKTSLSSLKQNEQNPLDQYTFHPPTKLCFNSKETQIYYHYVRLRKQFCIFNLPSRWYYPIDSIWTFLLVNKLINHDFVYIDFLDQNFVLNKSTHMPPCQILGQQSKKNQTEGEFLNQTYNLPLFAKPTHEGKCRWIHFQFNNHSQQKVQRTMWLNSQSDQNLFYDGFGFWKPSFDGVSVLYKSKNNFNTIIKYNLNAIPFITRAPNQPERSLNLSLNTLAIYIQHNKKIQQLLTSKEQQKLARESQNYSQNTTNTIFSQQIPNIGQFNVYGNKMIIGKFSDRVMITMKGQALTVIDDTGEQIILNLNKMQQKIKNIHNPYFKFQNHFKYMTDLYERVFHYNQWLNKQQLLQGLDDLKIANQAFINVCENIKKV